MIWKKPIYDSLASCTTLCDEFALECTRSEDIEKWYRSIFLALDCADMCRQVSILYVRGSENTPLLAKACLEVCEKLGQEVQQHNTDSCQQIYAICQQTICSCVAIENMASPVRTEIGNPTIKPTSLFYGKTLYN
ncbi:four-helix bundle copper-binding protein [Spirosoma sp. BT702]|uniref:Four-helix bundle copper-binding protein n=1 Tax=Spirosoma profusum TaxID=2771354 RepID=A0A926Y2T8_9BACT|nr:four-helix bundle copper-binding protein [Spirosoma profusum]MBD2702798.1 four-helix bundle copper-binding protein [Spirosoma profusum]